MTNEQMDSIEDERNLSDVDTAILVATQSWSNDPLPVAAKPGERRILWPVQDRDGSAEEYGLGPGFAW